MEIKKQANFIENFNVRIVEKFAELKGIPFDSIQAISELEQFRRLQSQLKKENSFEELIFLGKKMGIFFLSEKGKTSEFLKQVKPSFPVLVFTNGYGWILINSVLGPFIRFTRIATSESMWTIKKKLERSIQDSVDNNGLPEWIFLDNGFHSLGRNSERNQNYWQTIFEFIQLEKKDIWAIAIYSIAIGIFSLIIPIGIQSLVTILNFGTLLQPVLVLTFLVIFALGIVGLMNVLQSYVAELIQQRLFVRLAAKVTYLLPRANHKEMEKYYDSEIPNYFLDISIIQKSSTILLTSGLGIFLQTIIGLLVLVLYHPIFIIFNVLVIGIVIGIIFYLIGSVGIETSIKESKSKHKLASWIQEMNSHRTILRSASAHLYANLKTENMAREYIHSRRKHFKALMRQMIGFASLQAIGSGILLGIGGWLVIKGQITLGQFVASEIIVTKILDNLGKFTKYLENYYDLCASIDKVNHLLDFSEETSGQESVMFEREKPISIKVQDLQVATDNSILSPAPFLANAGEIVVIQNIPLYKSRKIFDLLFGLNPLKHGKVEVNSYYLQDINLYEWRDHVALLRDLEIFSGTIADTLKLNSLHSDSADIRTVLEKVGLMDRVQELPKGIHTEILRNGYPFIGEELALLTVARMLLSKPGLVLIDNILIHLSKKSIERLITILVELKKSSTFIISTSNSEFQKIADRVYTFQNETLTEKEKVKK